MIKVFALLIIFTVGRVAPQLFPMSPGMMMPGAYGAYPIMPGMLPMGGVDPLTGALIGAIVGGIAGAAMGA
ncbi:unnamed protein product [Strongylus vulgaris]|uniref:Uncharacterized protein n=1 Tax=Strongylus vulgaris TaxID=40348 RepID=A0A3P7I009_STRVU|nr:unnamed protein product [Strongylus vulgaris]